MTIPMSGRGQLAALLRSAVAELHRNADLGLLSDVAPEEAAGLVSNIISLAAFLDDSVSTAELGSPFDRTDGGTPVNRMLSGIAEAYGARHTFASTTGTSALNAAALMTLCGPGDNVIVDRGCHVSVGAGLVHSGARPHWLSPPYDARVGVLLPASPEDVSQALEDCPSARAVILTLPTYNGLAGRTSDIAKLCRRHDVRLMVDEAHGPHFRFLGSLGFPMDAITAGVDVVTQSTHKVLSTLNQGSLIHFGDDALAERYEAVQSLGFQSTSFSFPILASLEQGVRQMVGGSHEAWFQAAWNAERLRQGLDNLRGIKVLGADDFDDSRVAGTDPTRVTVNVRGLGITGWDAERYLALNGVIPEMASLDTLLFLIGPSHGDTVDAIIGVMTDLVIDSPLEPRTARCAAPPPPGVVITPREAFHARKRLRVPRSEAIGQIAAETIGAYPPGQTVIGPGETVTAEAVAFLEEVKANGGHLKRAKDDEFRTIEIVEEV